MRGVSRAGGVSGGRLARVGDGYRIAVALRGQRLNAPPHDKPEACEGGGLAVDPVVVVVARVVLPQDAWGMRRGCGERCGERARLVWWGPKVCTAYACVACIAWLGYECHARQVQV